MKKRTLILILTSLLLSLLLFLMQRTRPQGNYALVQIEGESPVRFSLFQEGEYPLNGGTNILLIKDGKACMKEADCPDRICVHQGWISRDGQTITCLPNRLNVVIVSDTKEADFYSS